MKIVDQGSQDIYDGIDSKHARRTLPHDLHEKAGQLLDRINAAARPFDLYIPRGNRLERLTGDREGQWSVRINDQYRICFSWENDEATQVEITDYH